MFVSARNRNRRPSPVLKNAFRFARLGGYGKRSSHNRARLRGILSSYRRERRRVPSRVKPERSAGTPLVSPLTDALFHATSEDLNSPPDFSSENFSSDAYAFLRPGDISVLTTKPYFSSFQNSFAGKSRVSPWVSSSATSPRGRRP